MPIDTSRGPAPPSVAFFLPAPALRELVTSYYIVSTDGPMRDDLHPEWANVRLAMSGLWTAEMSGRTTPTPRYASLYGPTDRTSHFETTGGRLMGIGLTPAGWIQLIGGDASALANGIRELGDGLGTPGEALAAALAADADDGARVARLDRLLLERVAASAASEPAIEALQAALLSADVIDIPGLARQVGLPVRSLHRLCLRVFGFGPKRLLKRQRFLRTLGRVRDRLNLPLAEVLDSEYYDQAHFIRDFRAFMDTTPSAYFNSPREVMRRAAVERLRVLGAPLQGLHRP